MKNGLVSRKQGTHSGGFRGFLPFSQEMVMTNVKFLILKLSLGPPNTASKGHACKNIDNGVH